MEAPKRQIAEVQDWAKRLDRSDNFPVELENFCRFVTDLRNYLAEHAPNQAVRDKLDNLPEIDYAATQRTVGGLFVRFLDTRRRQAIRKAREQVGEISAKFGSILWLWYAD